MANRTWILGVALLSGVLTGCASTAVRPPSPATHLQAQELLSKQPAPNEHFYLLLFGSEAIVPIPRRVHCFAAVVKTVGDVPCGNGTIRCDAISWMPATHVIHPWRFQVEPGVNVGLHATIKEMLDKRERIYLWGPYEIWHGLYERFLVQKEFLESGQVGYQCIDDIGEAARTGSGCDCIHAISDLDPLFDRKRYPLAYGGPAATKNIVRQLMTRPAVINPPITHTWLLPRLGLDRYPIHLQNYAGPVTPFSPEAVLALADQAASAQMSQQRGVHYLIRP
jgi:hypothetical protein